MPGNTSKTVFEELKNSLFTAHLNDQIQWFFENDLLREGNLSTFILMYDHYRNGVDKQDDFSQINKIIKSEIITVLWHSLLSEVSKEGSCAYLKYPSRTEHHPFHLIAGFCYQQEATHYTEAIKIYKHGYSKFLSGDNGCLLLNLKKFLHKLQPQNSAHKQLKKQLITARNKLKDTKDHTSSKEIDTPLSLIKHSIEIYILYAEEILENGINHGDFSCYIAAQEIDYSELGLLNVAQQIIHPSLSATSRTNEILSEKASILIRQITKRDNLFKESRALGGLLYSSKSNFYIALTFISITKTLLRSIPYAMKQILWSQKPISFFKEKPELSHEQRNFLTLIFHCQIQVNCYFNTALENLSSIDKIIHSIIRQENNIIQNLSELLDLDGQKYDTFDNFRIYLKFSMNTHSQSLSKLISTAIPQRIAFPPQIMSTQELEDTRDMQMHSFF